MTELSLRQTLVQDVNDKIKSNNFYLIARIVSISFLYIICILKLFYIENKESYSNETVFTNYFLFFFPLTIEYIWGLSPLTKMGNKLKIIGAVFNGIISFTSIIGVLNAIPKIILDNGFFNIILQYLPIITIFLVILDWFFSLNIKEKQCLISMAIFESIITEYDIDSVSKKDIKNTIEQEINYFIEKGVVK